MKTFIPILLVLCLRVAALTAQNPARSGRDYAVFFYTTNFQPGWQALPDIDAEVKDLASELKESYGFIVEFVPGATKTKIEEKIIELNRRSYGPNDQLLLFFSMHGHFLNSADRGYLVPADGKTPAADPLGKSWLSYDDLGAYLALNSCRHILLLLDACYSGAFGDRWKGYPGDVPPNPGDDCKAKEANALYHKSRLYFSSGSRERRTPAQSKFADRLLLAFRNGRSKKIIDVNELRYYFGTIEDPQPEGGTFLKDHQGGDFVFLHMNACGYLSPTALAYQRTDRDAWLQAKAADTHAAYRDYLDRFPRGEFRPLAEKRLAELDAEQREAAAWAKARQTNTTGSYDAFLQEYSNSAYRDLAVYYRDQLIAPTTPSTTTDLLNMVLVKGGDFQMGSDDGERDEKPVHKVTVSDFYLGRYEVTVEEFSEFIAATGYRTDADKDGGSYFWEKSKWEKKADINWKYDAAGKLRSTTEYKHPVIHVSWNDAVAYCNWRSEQEGLQKVYTISGSTVTANWAADGYRLPTEAEWEYAARSRGK